MDYIVTDTELTAVADAIRTKGDTEADLEWPSGFVSAIGALEIGEGSGGGNSNVVIKGMPPIKIPTYNYSYPLNIEDGWIGPFESQYACFYPSNGQGTRLDVDWGQPFEICVVFKRSQAHSNSMVLFGAETGSYPAAPSIELGNSGNIWCGFSTNGSSWTHSIAFDSNDGLTIQNDTVYKVVATWDGTDYTVTIDDGSNEFSKTITPGNAHYHNSSYLLCFGGMMRSSYHYARWIKMYLPDMYIKSNGVTVWEGSQ